MDDLTTCRRDLMNVEISNRNMPNLINRGKAVAALVTAAHREEVMESRRQAILYGLESVQLHGKVKLPQKQRKLKV
jgi:hypothetical protein